MSLIQFNNDEESKRELYGQCETLTETYQELQCLNEKVQGIYCNLKQKDEQLRLEAAQEVEIQISTDPNMLGTCLPELQCIQQVCGLSCTTYQLDCGKPKKRCHPLENQVGGIIKEIQVLQDRCYYLETKNIQNGFVMEVKDLAVKRGDAKLKEACIENKELKEKVREMAKQIEDLVKQLNIKEKKVDPSPTVQRYSAVAPKETPKDPSVILSKTDVKQNVDTCCTPSASSIVENVSDYEPGCIRKYCTGTNRKSVGNPVGNPCSPCSPCCSGMFKMQSQFDAPPTFGKSMIPQLITTGASFSSKDSPGHGNMSCCPEGPRASTRGVSMSNKQCPAQPTSRKTLTPSEALQAFARNKSMRYSTAPQCDSCSQICSTSKGQAPRPSGAQFQGAQFQSLDIDKDAPSNNASALSVVENVFDTDSVQENPAVKPTWEKKWEQLLDRFLEMTDEKARELPSKPSYNEVEDRADEDDMLAPTPSNNEWEPEPASMKLSRKSTVAKSGTLARASYVERGQMQGRNTTDEDQDDGKWREYDPCEIFRQQKTQDRFDARKSIARPRVSQAEANLAQQFDTRKSMAPQQFDTRKSMAPQQFDTRKSMAPQQFDTRKSMAPQQMDTRKSMAPQQLDTRKSMAPQQLDTRKSMAPQQFDTRKSMAPQQMDTRKSMAPQQMDTRKSMAPQQLDTRKSMAQQQLEPRKSMAPQQLESRKSMTPQQFDTRKSMAQEQLESRKTVAPEQFDTRKSMAPQQFDTRKSMAPQQFDTRKSVAPEQFDTRKSMAPQQFDTRKSIAPEQFDTRKSMAPQQFDTRKSIAPQQFDTRKSVAPEQFDTRKSMAPQQFDTRKSMAPQQFDTRKSMANPVTAEDDESTWQPPQYDQRKSIAAPKPSQDRTNSMQPTYDPCEQFTRSKQLPGQSTSIQAKFDICESFGKTQLQKRFSSGSPFVEQKPDMMSSTRKSFNSTDASGWCFNPCADILSTSNRPVTAPVLRPTTPTSQLNYMCKPTMPSSFSPQSTTGDICAVTKSIMKPSVARTFNQTIPKMLSMNLCNPSSDLTYTPRESK